MTMVSYEQRGKEWCPICDIHHSHSRPSRRSRTSPATVKVVRWSNRNADEILLVIIHPAVIIPLAPQNYSFLLFQARNPGERSILVTRRESSEKTMTKFWKREVTECVYMFLPN
jgi:hypothetical protein